MAGVSLKVEPVESSRLVFLPMAPGIAGGPARGRAILVIDITNATSQELVADAVTISFPGSDLSAVTRRVFWSSKSDMLPVVIGAQQTVRWHFQHPGDHVVFDLPAPPNIALTMIFKASTEKATVELPLAAHVSPVAGGAYGFPAGAADLALGEFWSTNGCTHAMGGGASQGFAYDMGVWGVDHQSDTYGPLHPGKDHKKNEHHRIWGKRILAMADGAVLHSLNVCPTNPKPYPGGLTKAEDAAFWAAQEKLYGSHPFGGAGNHFYIRHGDEVVLYAHMQPGTLNPTLLAPGTKVRKGDFLGLAGNSGSSSAPHLHIHAIQGTQPEEGICRPILFKDAFAIDNDLVLSEPRSGLWSRLSRSGIPEGHPSQWHRKDSFISPSGSPPPWPEVAHLEVSEAGFQSDFDSMAALGLLPVWIDGFTTEGVFGLPVRTFFNVVFRPADVSGYVALVGRDANDFKTAVADLTGKGFRPVQVTNYFSFQQRRVCHAGIFHASPGPESRPYHGLDDAAHKPLFDEMKKTGFVPVQASVVSGGGRRQHAGLYEKRPVGSFVALPVLTLAAFQKEVLDQKRSLVYASAHRRSGQTFISAIWHEKGPSAASVEFHLNAGEFAAAVKDRRKNGLQLRGVSGYSRNGSPNHVALWTT